MLNFSRIPPRSQFGRFVRLPLALVPDNAVLPVMQGPLRGRRWIAGSSIAGCWLGSYELEKQRSIAKFVRPGMTCWDIGANVGFYTLLFSRLVRPEGTVWSFEPLQRNLSYLRKHVAMNPCDNVRVIPAALGDFDGEATFAEGPTHAEGRISPAGTIKVRCSTADTLLGSRQVATPDVIKLDVEGAEARVLTGAGDLLRTRRPIVFVATHGADVHAQVWDLLEVLNYRITDLKGGVAAGTDELIGIPA